MRVIKLGTIPSHDVKGKSLVAIDERWKNFFIGEPTFEAIIDKNGNFVLVGPQVKLQPTKRNPHYSKEVPMNENNL